MMESVTALFGSRASEFAATTPGYAHTSGRWAMHNKRGAARLGQASRTTGRLHPITNYRLACEEGQARGGKHQKFSAAFLDNLDPLVNSLIP
jgi:hypothetical protein